MNRLQKLSVLAVAAVLAIGCEVFQDPTPKEISFRMSGSAGDIVTVIYSKQFVAGVNELGVTRVEVCDLIRCAMKQPEKFQETGDALAFAAKTYLDAFLLAYGLAWVRLKHHELQHLARQLLEDKVGGGPLQRWRPLSCILQPCGGDRLHASMHAVATA